MDCTKKTAFLIRLPPGEAVDDNYIEFVAASPAEAKSSFSGSALPFTNACQAFYRTPNRGRAVLVRDNVFQVDLFMPNSYYTGLGTVEVLPTVHIRYRSYGRDRRRHIQIGPHIPFRSLTFPPAGKLKRSIGLYDADYPWVRSQEQILLASAYPQKNNAKNVPEPDNFWGTRPPG